MRLPLDGAWTVQAVGPLDDLPAPLAERIFPATVPGCIHTDLLAANAIDDPFDGDNETRYAWIGRTAWRYRRTFTWLPDDAPHIDLVADGLDTFATIELNGTVIAQTSNQHRRYRFDITAALLAGENSLTITFAAPLNEAEKRELEHGGALPHVNAHPFNTVRKMASNFGWDWGIDAPTSGIWKSVAIETWNTHRIDAVRPLVDVIGGVGVLTAHVQLAAAVTAEPVAVTIRVSSDGETVGTAECLVRGSGTVRVAIAGVKLWWPRGHGEQPLYDVRVSLGGAAADEPSTQWRGRVGFRTTRLDTSVDADGARFSMLVNDRQISIRGANWIPDHAFITEMSPARYAQRINDATEANVNLLRVWGGGIYESDDFYTLCDELGVLVWQDFLFACAAYAEESWLADEIEAEVRDAVTRLSPHPSLVLWNGNNESYLAYTEWGWRQELHGRTWGDGLFTKVFPRLLAELDPTRMYTPGSPFSFDPYLRPNEDTDGTVHIWDVWNDRDYSAYRDWNPRFVAEFGFQGPPAWSTLSRVVHDSPLDADGAQMLIHQKAERGNEKLAAGMLGHLPVPATIDDWHFSTQLNQAHAIRFSIEYFRSLAPYNTGMILWQLNDNWPVISWSAVDFDGHRKPVWYALRAAYSPHLATLQADASGVTLTLLNDTENAFSGSVVIARTLLGGDILESETIEVRVDARATSRIRLSDRVSQFEHPTDEILTATPSSHFERTVLNGAEVIDQNLDPAPFRAEWMPGNGGYAVRVSATTYVRDLVILADKVDPQATVDVGMISLLAGETATIFVQTTHPNPDDLLSSRVLRCANQLGDPGKRDDRAL